MRKITALTLLLFLFSCSPTSSEEVRRSAVAGTFYPADKHELTQTVDTFLANVKKIDIKGRPLAIIVPHAGYAYSGQVAAHGFKQLEGTDFKKIIIISPSHYVGFDGISVYNKGFFETPLGRIKVNEELADRIIKTDKRFLFYPEAHEKEHAIEVELPFLQRIYKGKDFSIVPIAMGSPLMEDARILSGALYDVIDDDTLLIISVDLSHYHPYDEAVKLDTSGISAVEKLDADWLLEQLRDGDTEIDAPIAVLASIMLANSYNARAKVLRYANSGDVTGDKSRVVGYSSIVMYIPSPQQGEGKGEGAMIMKDEYLSKEEKQKLLQIAKASVVEAVTGKKQAKIEVTEKRLKENCGAFVTLKKQGQLRGCIGYIIAVKPLYETVKDVAMSAAINDHRFSPVTEKELDSIDIEISALTPLKRISDINEIEVGKHGLYMKQGFSSGLLLPQVAAEYSWDRKTFLDQTCRKAGLSANAWQDPATEIYTFSAEVFGE
ncbi:MAG: AmmeMemoRadiSam system protein B [Candidatus Omnitrophica bacterium]|nr:AmmeMemoRadiSam system protein B [Candidatus Omnitrophota bacterium]